MRTTALRSPDIGLPRFWPLLFPLTFAAHITEEYAGGFPVWAARWLGFHLSTSGFLELNATAWVLMLCATVAASIGPRWLVVPFATATFVNGCAHVLATVLTLTYSPGVITGATLWIPLGAFTLLRAFQRLPRDRFWAGVAVGIVLHGLVVLYARFS